MQMKELAKALDVAPDKLADNAAECLTQAAADWASFSILNLADPLLDKAMAISTAIARFTTELERLEKKEGVYHE